MEEDFVEKLMDFGLSVNQAKVYLSIIQSASTTVNKISETTHIFRQDIYKILPKLEEMGLITKTVDRPVTIEAIPVEEALSHIVDMEQQKANQRTRRLNANLETLAKAIEKIRVRSETETQAQAEIEVSFISTERAIKHKIDLAFENARTRCDAVLNFDRIMGRLPIFRKRFQALATNKVAARLLVNVSKEKNSLESRLKEIIPSIGDFAVKLTAGKTAVKPYLIVDRKELYIRTQKETSFGSPCVIITNSKNVISIYEDNFEKAWNNHCAITIHPAKKETPTLQ